MLLWKHLKDIIIKTFKMKNFIIILLSLVTISSFSQNQQELNLMPWPQKITLGNSQFVIQPDFTIAIPKNSSKRVVNASTKFLRRLTGRTGVFINEGFAFEFSENEIRSLEIHYKKEGKLEINEDESYELKVSTSKITISAPTDLGVVHALETLLQLTTTTPTNYYFPEVVINDFPRFTWRGLMIDVARHFEPVDVIKRNLDAMAAVKMNVFHWHLTDDQGFRIESKTHPELHELASDGLYYSQEQIKDIVQYAANLGIRVVPEVDVPGHATAILTAFPEIGSKDTIFTIERNSGIFDATLDPTNEKTYIILGDLFGEMATLFPDEYVHIGGDENEGKHWDESEHIQAFMKANNIETNHELQTYFNLRLEVILRGYGKKIMGWEEIMTDKMPTTALIHSWRGVNEGVAGGGSLVVAAKLGFNTVLSNGYYIDLMLPVSEHYLVDPMPINIDLTAEEKARILGGEATMWSELVTPLTIDSRIWPRTAAIAERFWSSADITDIENMYERLEYVSFTLEELGITHIRNRNVILRNITNNQDIFSLDILAKVCEPLKVYTRNQGGTEYKTFSPFTLFADACNVDAPDSFLFNEAVNNYFENQNEVTTKSLISFFDTWISGYNSFKSLKESPILNGIYPIYKNLGSISKEFKLVLENNSITDEQVQKIRHLLKEMEQPVVDVELAVLPDFKNLAIFLIQNKGN
jgi:hexosaminidase